MEQFITYKLNSVLKDITLELLHDENYDNIELPEDFTNDTVNKVTDALMNTENSSDDYARFYDYSTGEPYLIRFIKYIASPIVENALEEYRYDLETADKVVVLDGNEMVFGSSRVPAYWYDEGMSEEEIAEELKKYRGIWRDLGFRENIKYPVLECYRSVRGKYRHGFTDELFAQMERDLERQDSEEARDLLTVIANDLPDYAILEHYPNKLKDVVIKSYEGKNTERFYEGYDMFIADLVLKSGEIVPVKIGIDGNRLLSTTAIGSRGFPMLTDKDTKMVETKAAEYLASFQK